MSIATAANTSVTVAAGPRGYPDYDRHYSTHRISSINGSESGRRIGIQDLINEAPIRPSIEQFNLDRQHNQHNQFSRYSLSPPQLPLPLPQQAQAQQHLIPTPPSMELDSYKLPTPLTSPTSVPVSSPSLAPIQSYSPISSSSSVKSLDDQTSYMTTIQTSGMIMPLSLQERRERNKIASAKYRAKKHRQNQEMSTTIAELTAENNVLLRQIEEVKAENSELKELVDKLKSKLVEGKILKRLGRGGTKLSLSPASTADDDLDITCNSNLSTTIRKNSTKRGGFSGHAKGTGPSTKGVRK